MKQCSQLQDYLAGFLRGPQEKKFEFHTETCESCAQEAAVHHQVDSCLKDWMAAQTIPPAAPNLAASIMESAEKIKNSHSLIPKNLRIPALAAVAAAALIFLAVHSLLPNKNAAINSSTVAQQSNSDAESPAKFKVLINANATTRVAGFGKKIQVSETGRVLVAAEGDTIGVDAGSDIVIEKSGTKDARIELLKGTVAIQAEKRKKDESLVVSALGHTVKVVGTRFSVSIGENQEVIVRVDSGKVAVQSPNGDSQVVETGQVLISDKANTFALSTMDDKSTIHIKMMLSPEKPEATKPETIAAISVDADAEPNVDDIDTMTSPQKTSPRTTFDINNVRQLIISGNTSKAEQFLTQRVNDHPRDADAWLLLADCQRKATKWKSAVKTYNYAIERGLGSVANRARFQSGVLMQEKLGDHRGAATMFSNYLRQPNAQKPLEADAMFRLAKALKRTGKNVESNHVLTKIITNHQGTTTAVEARKMLQQQ